MMFFFASFTISAFVAVRWGTYALKSNEIELANFSSTCILTAYVFTAFTTQLNLFSLGYGYAKDYFAYNQFYLSFSFSRSCLTVFILDVYGIVRPIKLKL